jgi:hypothetical protein
MKQEHEHHAQHARVETAEDAAPAKREQRKADPDAVEAARVGVSVEELRDIRAEEQNKWR